MKGKIKGIVSAALSVIMIMSSAQATLCVLAEELSTPEKTFDTAIQDKENPTSDAVLPDDLPESPYIVGEDLSYRKENEKHFRQSDGSYMI